MVTQPNHRGMVDSGVDSGVALLQKNEQCKQMQKGNAQCAVIESGKF